MGLFNMLHTTTDTLLLPILILISESSTWSPRYKGHVPASCISPTLVGHTITSTVSPIRGFTLHSRIWVWNVPNLTCSFTRMGSSIPLSVDSGTGFGPSPCSHCPLAKNGSSTLTQQARSLGCCPRDRQPVNFSLLSH